MTQGIKVPDEVVEAMVKIKESGKHNMFDSQSVIYFMYRHRMQFAADWLTTRSASNKINVDTTRYTLALMALEDMINVTEMLHNV